MNDLETLSFYLYSVLIYLREDELLLLLHLLPVLLRLHKLPADLQEHKDSHNLSNIIFQFKHW